MSRARLVPGGLDRLHHDVERRLVGRQHRREAAFVAHRGRELHLGQHLLERVEHLDAHAESLGKGVGADRHDHELLGVHVVRGVGAAVQDVHHRHRQHARHRAAEIAVERQPASCGRGPRHRERHRQDRVGAELALVGRAVEIQHLLVDRHLVLGGHPFEPRADAPRSRSAPPPARPCRQ